MRLFMSATSTKLASNFSSRYENPTLDCGGAQMRAHCRHLATVVTIQGEIDAHNVDRVGARLRHLILAKNPLVVDLSGVNSFAATGISLLHRLDEDCCAAGVQWTLVASRPVIEVLRDFDERAVFPFARSVHEALGNLADVIVTRRQLLLPLITKTP
jgi:anti-anti-sigma factor